GGMEHTTLHLLYSRFWHKFLYDQGIVPSQEPYQKRTSHGMILGENGVKMSKSRGNVVNPDDVIDEYGADTLRMYEMFIGDFEKSAPWSTQGIKGCRRFIERTWKLMDKVTEEETYSADLEGAMHRCIKKVSQDNDAMKFNTAIAAQMELINQFYNKGSITRGELRTFLQLMNPVAPHVTEEMWQQMGFEKTIAETSWPGYDESKMVENTVEIAVQICGKVRAQIMINKDLKSEEAIACAKADERIAAQLEGKTIVKEIYVPGRIVNIVAR
ncbi:MAG: class I tRNA ligase family protein, partial [Lachnospiraceae bacterium]|nr:class I tRNA ligase family protein [Lachnospiraceae bacterium]